MTGKRSYGDSCGIARGLDVVGDRWALLVVRELLLGPKRFTDLRSGLPNLSPDVLSLRLRELEQAGVLTRATLSPPAASRVYALTARGHGLEPVLLALAAWGSEVPFPPEAGPLGPDSLIIALKTLFRPPERGQCGRFELRVDGQPFRADVEPRDLRLERGTAPDPDAVIETDAATLSRILWHGEELEAAVRSGSAKLTGSVPAARTFLALFPPPAVNRAGPARVG